MDDITYNSHNVDFSPLLVPKKRFAVRCESKEEAIAFVNAMIDNFPHKCRHWVKGESRWRNDLNGQYGGRAYFPDVNDMELDDLVVGDVQFALDHGYTIVKFSDLIEQPEIEESDISIDVLLS